MTPRVFVEVSDKYLWALRPFAYLFNLFWSELQPVVVFGYGRPNFDLPPNFIFHSIYQDNYPAERWSNGLIEFLRVQNDEHFIFMLADYWLCRTVDVRGIDACYQYVRDKADVLKMDLTADREYSYRGVDIDFYGSYDIIQTDHVTAYQFSLQTAIWNKARMLDLLENGKSPWEVEMYTEIPDTIRVLGTRQWPLRYANGISKGAVDWEQIKLIPRDHREVILTMIPSEFGGSL